MDDIEKFIHGFTRFQQRYLGEQSMFDTLRKGQHPGTLLIGCCDSRVDSTLIPAPAGIPSHGLRA